MPTENNDYVNWLANHAAEEENHNKNQTLNKKVYTLKQREYNLPMEYENYPTEYRKPLSEVLNCDPKWQQMSPKELKEQARIQLEKQQYTTQQTRFGPYSNAA
jgi:hypothetical protein